MLPEGYELRVEFAGLCLYVVDPSERAGLAKKVGIVMPDARKRTNPVHADGAKGDAHAGYIRFDLANVVGFDVEPGTVDVGTGSPPNELVHRFNHEEIDFGLGDTRSPVEHEIKVPNFDEFTDGITPIPGLFNPAGPPPAAPLLMRTIINGGSVRATGSGKTWGFSPVLRSKPNGGYSGQFAGFVVWSRWVNEPELQNGIVVTIRNFDGRVSARIPLKPVPITDENGETRNRITIKVANLCSNNPLEWDDFRLRNVVDRDIDFKWLYRLLESKSARLEDRLSHAELPYPREVSIQAYGDEDCMGGSITSPIP